jgi:hypothetical protein
MSFLTKIRDQVITALQASPAFAGVKVLAEYAPGIRDNPLTQPVISVGIGAVNLSDGAFSNYLGRYGEGAAAQDAYGKQASVTLRIGICVPRKAGGGRASELFTELADTLYIADGAFALSELTCGEVSFQSNSGGYCLSCIGTLRALAVRTHDAGGSFSNILIKGVK